LVRNSDSSGLAPVRAELRASPAAKSALVGLRVLIVHEWLYTWAGAERCLEELLIIVPQAQVIAGTITPDIRAAQPIARTAKETWLGGIPGARKYHRWFVPLQPLAFASIDTSGYDVVISLSHSFAKLVRAKTPTRHLCYCLSPPRYLWDLRETYDNHSPLAQRLALRIAGAPLRAIDRWGAAGVDRFVSISACVADRVRRVYARESDVVHPPVASKGNPGVATRQPFLLSLGRLVPYKRVDLAIRAAEQLRMKLVVAGDGPDRARLESLAGPHTEFLGAVSDDEAGRLYSTCAAFVFCAEEDFGIAPVEANAHGTPVVAYARGGAAETMVDGTTAILFQRQSGTEVAEAIQKCLRHTWDPEVLRTNAERFSPQRFRDDMTAQIRAAVGPRTGRQASRASGAP
jgi:glycosyltransferase involved in cell wall biosynthesis